MSARDVEIMKACKAQGKRPEDLTPGERNRLVLKTMRPTEKVRAVGSAMRATVEVSVLHLQVLPATYEERRSTCEANTCGMFKRTKGNLPWCVRCGCGGRNLDKKWRQRKSRCPLPKPLW